MANGSSHPKVGQPGEISQYELLRNERIEEIQIEFEKIFGTQAAQERSMKVKKLKMSTKSKKDVSGPSRKSERNTAVVSYEEVRSVSTKKKPVALCNRAPPNTVGGIGQTITQCVVATKSFNLESKQVEKAPTQKGHLCPLCEILLSGKTDYKRHYLETHVM
eukprot:GFUD01084521.1.p1 GENE.GFUD01084521.1~~GFUD01084521.1.p1  ORF type:complete len:162 (+),score=33.29 GFUD01084521.1:45-530(+)